MQRSNHWCNGGHSDQSGLCCVNLMSWVVWMDVNFLICVTDVISSQVNTPYVRAQQSVQQSMQCPTPLAGLVPHILKILCFVVFKYI